jgi:hypothetical protein
MHVAITPEFGRSASGMTPVALVEHKLPGRLRLRIPSRRGDVLFFARVIGALSKHPDVKELAANPLTGGLLILHAGSVQALTAEAARQGFFEIGTGEPRSAQSKTAYSKTAPSKTAQGGKSRPTAAIAAGGSGPLDAIATALSGLALFQATQGQALGNATENFWHAYGAHRILGRPGIAAGFALAGVYQVLRGQLFGAASSLLFYSLIARQLADIDRAVGVLSGEAAAGNKSASSPASR